uniref:Putative secreted protein n=1 Tax=Ixodes ricinus TaxID=34613 RepID=A0A6B0UMX3_IXORI
MASALFSLHFLRNCVASVRGRNPSTPSSPQSIVYPWSSTLDTAACSTIPVCSTEGTRELFTSTGSKDRVTHTFGEPSFSGRAERTLQTTVWPSRNILPSLSSSVLSSCTPRANLRRSVL